MCVLVVNMNVNGKLSSVGKNIVVSTSVRSVSEDCLWGWIYEYNKGHDLSLHCHVSYLRFIEATNVHNSRNEAGLLDKRHITAKP